jgi:hypothetical protein
MEKDLSSGANGPFAEELRSRLIAQIKISTALKDHLAACNKELSNLRKERGVLEFRIRELSQELTLAKTLSKPVSQYFLITQLKE